MSSSRSPGPSMSSTSSHSASSGGGWSGPVSWAVAASRSRSCSIPVHTSRSRDSTRPSVYSSSVAPAGASSSTASKSTPPTPIGAPGRYAQHLGAAAQVQQHRRRVAGVGDGDPVRDRVVHGVQAGRHAVGAEPLGLLVEVVQDLLRRQVEPGQGLRGGPQLAHDRGGGHGVAHDVADDQRDPAAGQRDRVVPVAADPGGLGGRQVAGGEPHAGAAAAARPAASCAAARRRCTPRGRTAPPCRCRARVCVASWAATSRSFGSKAGRSGRRRKTRGADHPAPAAQRGEDRPLAARHGSVRAEQLGQRGRGGGGVAEDGPYAAQHLGERPAGPDLAQLGGGGRAGRRAAVGCRSAAAKLARRCPAPATAAGRCGAAAARTAPTGRSSPTGSGSRR